MRLIQTGEANIAKLGVRKCRVVVLTKTEGGGGGGSVLQ